MFYFVFFQWVNQSFNALVNYTNRNANSPLTVNQLGVSYLSATGSALAVAIGFKGFLQKHASPFAQVPYQFQRNHIAYLNHFLIFDSIYLLK